MSSNVIEVNPGDQVAFPVSEEEQAEYEGLPKSVVLKRYMKAHRTEKCAHCQKLIGNHSEKAFGHCVSHETEKLRSDRAIQQTVSLEPTEVEMVVCPKCEQMVPPAFACIRCGQDLRKKTLSLDE